MRSSSSDPAGRGGAPCPDPHGHGITQSLRWCPVGRKLCSPFRPIINLEAQLVQRCVREHAEPACMKSGVAHGMRHQQATARPWRARRVLVRHPRSQLFARIALHIPPHAVSTALTPLTTAYSRYRRHRCVACGESACRDHRQTRQNGRSRDIVRSLNARHGMMVPTPLRAR